ERGPMRLFTDAGAAGILARRAIPALIGVPIVIGLFRVLGERARLYDAPFGSALRTLSEIALFLILLWWTGIAIDLQARRQKETDEALQASQKRVIDTLENISDGFVTIDRNWRFTYVNAEGERLLRKTRAQLLGRMVWDLFPESAGGVAQKQLERVSTTRTSVEFEDYNPLMQRWFANKAHPTTDGGMVVYYEDVTLRKQAGHALLASRKEVRQELTDTKLLQRLSVELIREADVPALYRAIVDAAVSIMRSDFASMQMLHTDRGAHGELRLLAHHGFTAEAAKFW